MGERAPKVKEAGWTRAPRDLARLSMTCVQPDDLARREGLAFLQERLFGPILQAEVSDQLKLNARYVRMRLDQRRLDEFPAYLRLAVEGQGGLGSQAAREGLHHVRDALEAFTAWLER